MPVLQTADGRLLTRRPSKVPLSRQDTGFSTWTDRYDPSDAADEPSLVSFGHIYRTQPVVAAAINKLARQVATLPLKVYRKDANGDKDRVEDDHPLSLLLRKPLPRRGAVNAKQWMIFPTLLHGNALVGKVRPDPESPPSFLLPLDWSCLSAYAEQGQFIEWWSTTQFGDEGQRWIRAEDAVHIAWESSGGEVGVSPLEQLGTTIQVEDAAKRQQRAAFRNGIFPSIAVSLGEGQNGRPPDKEMVELTRQSINTIHKNPDQAFKAMLLAPGTDVKALAISAREAELSETRQISKDEVAMVFDVPPPLLGDLRHATLANLAEFSRQFYSDILRPWLTLIEETLQAQLIDSEPWGEEGLYVEFDLSEKLKGDPKEQAEVVEIGVRSGQNTPNEGRAFRNLKPEGDPNDPENPANQLYLPVNNLKPIGSEAPAPVAVDDMPPPPTGAPPSKE